MSETDKSEESGVNDRDGDELTVMGVLGDTIRELINDPDADAAEGKDLPDDASGEEVPQDGDPGR